MTEYIQINPADNVAVALHPLSKGTIIEVNGNFIELAEDIPAGHKIALKDFAEGDRDRLVPKFVGTFNQFGRGCYAIHRRHVRMHVQLDALFLA